MTAASGNIYADLTPERGEEEFTALVSSSDLRLERIVSTGQTTPEGQWLEQDSDEWVILLRGAAGLRFEGEVGAQLLAAGDYLHIPAHRRHRVDWTAPGEATVWLALHYR
ncbi:MAG: cupin [Stellaceae bacterium]